MEYFCWYNLQIKSEKRESSTQLRTIQFGESFIPFADLDVETFVNGQESLDIQGFFLEGVGPVNIHLELELNLDSPKIAQFVAEGPNGKPILKNVPAELYELQVTIDFEKPDIQSDDGLFSCKLAIGDLHLMSKNSEEQFPARAGYATFFEWKSSPEDEHEMLLIPGSFITAIQLTFERIESVNIHR